MKLSPAFQSIVPSSTTRIAVRDLSKFATKGVWYPNRISVAPGKARNEENPRAGILINTLILIEGETGKSIYESNSLGIHSCDRGQPPGYHPMVFRKYQPEVCGSGTFGATDQPFLRNGFNVYPLC
jgi:hypothetical protein